MENTITTTTQTGDNVNISYTDLGNGRPVILIHGWPLSQEMWEYQVEDLLLAGFRVITYDRRGFGKSSKPSDGYDYDSFAEDLHTLIETLNLQQATLIGFSMGGGEIVRYIHLYGKTRLHSVVLMSAITPFLLKTSDNIHGVDPSVFTDMIDQIKADRAGFLEGFGTKFFGINLLAHPVSNPSLEYYRMLALQASPIATKHCVTAFAKTDFRAELAAIDLPALILHGTGDSIVPIEKSGNLTAKMIPHARYIVYDGAPHGLFYTHKDHVNTDIVDFLKHST